jgi:hypothetical protein
MSNPREPVRRATMRALARARSTPGKKLDGDEKPWIRGYLAISASWSNADALALLTPDADGREARLGILTALGDASPDPRLAALLVAIVDTCRSVVDRETVDLVARAAARVGATELVAWLIDALAFHDTHADDGPHRLWRGPAGCRATLRAALAALGEPAFERLEAAMCDRQTGRRLRMHLPSTLGEFKNSRAVDVLLAFLADGDDGHVRYRCLRALERLVTESGMRVPPARARALARRELTEYFRLLALRSGLDPAHHPPPTVCDDTRAIMVRLLDDKCNQAVERAFRLLELGFPSEDLLEVHAAVTSGEASTRANAIEFLDALLAPRRRRDHDGIRGLLRLVAEDLPDVERVARAAVVPPDAIPRSPEAAIELLRADRDRLVATLALSLAEEHAS